MFKRNPAWPVLAALMLAVLMPTLVRAAESQGLTNLFFPFDNGVGRGQWTPEQQAQTVKEFGFDGIGYNFQPKQPELLDQWLTELHKRGLKLIDIYVAITLPKNPQQRPWDYLREPIRKLKGTGTIVWAPVWGAKHNEPRDEDALKALNEVADWCEASGIKLCLYAHAGAYTNTADDCLRLARKLNRPEVVGVSLNLCHEMSGGNAGRLTRLPQEMGPYLLLVSINGANKAGGIMTLDRGDFDIYPFLTALYKAGYQGPIGIQCIGRMGDIRENLARDMKQWKAFNARLAAEAKQAPTKVEKP